jgi:hypothetical protein
MRPSHWPSSQQAAPLTATPPPPPARIMQQSCQQAGAAAGAGAEAGAEAGAAWPGAGAEAGAWREGGAAALQADAAQQTCCLRRQQSSLALRCTRSHRPGSSRRHACLSGRQQVLRGPPTIAVPRPPPAVATAPKWRCRARHARTSPSPALMCSWRCCRPACLLQQLSLKLTTLLQMMTRVRQPLWASRGSPTRGSPQSCWQCCSRGARLRLMRHQQLRLRQQQQGRQQQQQQQQGRQQRARDGQRETPPTSGRSTLAVLTSAPSCRRARPHS